MNQITDTSQIGQTFQMNLDAFLEERHPVKTANQDAYEAALQTLEELKHFRSPQKKVQIAKASLHICIDCIEAHLALGIYTQDIYERIEIYRSGMELATMNLGKEFFLREVHDFYTCDEAKPLLHIKFAYAATLFEAGNMRKAEREFRKILNLNPNDDLYTRHYLYTIFLYFEEFEQCKLVLNRFPKNESFHVYTKFLLLMKMESLKQAKACIPDVIHCNEFLYDMLTFKKMTMLTSTNSKLEAGSLEEASYMFRILSKVTKGMEHLHIFMMKSE